MKKIHFIFIYCVVICYMYVNGAKSPILRLIRFIKYHHTHLAFGEYAFNWSSICWRHGFIDILLLQVSAVCLVQSSIFKLCEEIYRWHEEKNYSKKKYTNTRQKCALDCIYLHKPLPFVCSHAKIKQYTNRKPLFSTIG